MLIFQSKNFILSYFNNCYRLLNRDDKAAAATDKPVLITNGGQGLMEKGNKKKFNFPGHKKWDGTEGQKCRQYRYGQKRKKKKKTTYKKEDKD